MAHQMKDCSNNALIPGNQCQNLKVLLFIVMLIVFWNSFYRVCVFILVTFLVIFSFEFLFPNFHFLHHSIKVNILCFIVITWVTFFRCFFSLYWFLLIHCISDYAFIFWVRGISFSNITSPTFFLRNLKHIDDHFLFVSSRSIEHRMDA